MKNIFVFGGSKGIGSVFASLAKTMGSNVCVFSRTKHKDDGLDFAEVDLCDIETVKKVVTSKLIEYKTVDSVVFCQRYRGNDKSFSAEMTASVEATQVVTELCVDYLKPGSSIVLVCSNASNKVAVEQPFSYHASKAAIEQLVRYYAVKLGKFGIRVNGVSPALTVKPENEAFYSLNPDLTEIYSRYIPLGRMGRADDVAEVMMFLLNVSFVTGQIITVDGGLSLLSAEGLIKNASGFSDDKLVHPKK